MLSLFPELLDWAWYVPLVFRIFLGIYVAQIGWRYAATHARVDPKSSAAYLFGGSLLFLFGVALLFGLFVQALGAIGFVLALAALYFKRAGRNVPEVTESGPFYVLFGLTALALIFLGPGPYSIDLPL